MNTLTNKLRANLNIETLEDRLALSLTTVSLVGTTLRAWSNDSASNITISRSGSTTTIRDTTNGFVRSFTSTINLVEVVGGAGNDRIVNNVRFLPMNAWGQGGDDYLEGYDGNDNLMGGPGNDILRGYGGNDRLWGGTGNDVLLGMAGDDQLMGEDGNDRLNGGAGNDRMWGGNGEDVIIAINNSTRDWIQGDGGRDIIWVDRNGWSNDTINAPESQDRLHYISSFANGADRTLNGDNITDPIEKAGHTKKRFGNNPLFSSSGPSRDDIVQGSLGDCWLLAGLSAIAMDNPFAIRSNVVDFDDGTYGVRLGSNYYRVDNELAVASSSSTTPVYAKLGRENSMWVAIVEKAYAHYRSGANTYASLEGGWSVEVNRAFGSSSAGEKAFNTYSSATALANDIYNRWNNFEAVTVGFHTVASGCPCIGSHQYTVAWVTRNSFGTVVSITLRNPWGVDGAGSDGNDDGYVTVTPAQIFGSTGRVNWGRVA